MTRSLPSLSAAEKSLLTDLIKSDAPIPDSWRHRLFPQSAPQAASRREYHLDYAGKASREEILARTPVAPWQLVRSFHSAEENTGAWHNKIVWGDNLMALRELLADQQGPNRLQTRGKIRLVYIDPPFATKQDFLKDKEKAYRDKVTGAAFIEFLRRRLVLLRELLADDGSIFIHLDWKKSHYIKVVLDEVFGEDNFVTEIVWRRTTAHFTAERFAFVHDSIFQYSKTRGFVFNKPQLKHSEAYLRAKYKYVDTDGRRYRLSDASGAGHGEPRLFYGRTIMPPAGRHWPSQNYIDEHQNEYVLGDDGMPQKKSFLKGATLGSLWDDISPVNSQAHERLDYPTQKPEELLERIIYSSSNPGDVVLDCFVGSGTTAAVAEKMQRKWIAMDCGKLSIYTTQRRLLDLTSCIGAGQTDDRTELQRLPCGDRLLHEAPAVLIVTDKARAGEYDVSDDFLEQLAVTAAVAAHARQPAPVAIACSEVRLKLTRYHLLPSNDEAFDYSTEVNGVRILITILPPRDTTPRAEPLKAQPFSLYRAGNYDQDALRDLPWQEYRELVLKLFAVRRNEHSRYGFIFDGHVGTDSTYVWNYPDNPGLAIDYQYVRDLHELIRGKHGERINIIVPVLAMAFAEDEVTCDKTTYVFLKVPLSVLRRLIEHGEAGSFTQPAHPDAVNDIIDACGFDFVSQPRVDWTAFRSRAPGEIFSSTYIRLTEFRPNTLTSDPEDFANFEALSLVMVDTNYDGAAFRLRKVFWGLDLIANAGGPENATALELLLTDEEFEGETAMIVLCDRYGNEKTVAINKAELSDNDPQRLDKRAVTKKRGTKQVGRRRRD